MVKFDGQRSIPCKDAEMIIVISYFLESKTQNNIKCQTQHLIRYNDESTDHFWYLTLRNPLKTSPSELT